MEKYFGLEGLLAQKVPHFEYRAVQLEMARAVAQCLAKEVPLMVEAGTGTGKTWAYLIPAILSGKKVVISTGTKTLQDQILDHDIPMLRRFVHPPLKAICLKGRKNYLCKRRLREFSYQPTLYNKEEAQLYKRFQQWTTRTVTGDRAEVEWLPDQFYTWNEVSSSSDQCLGQQCEDSSRCHLTRLRQEAQQAQLLVVNHHLFFADLSLRMKGLGEVLPGYDAVVFDEAHLLEDTIGAYFGVQFSSVRLNELLRDLQRELTKGAVAGRKVEGLGGARAAKIGTESSRVAKLSRSSEIRSVIGHMEALGRALHKYLAGSRGSVGRFRLDLEKAGKEFVKTCQQLLHALDQLAAMLSTAADDNPTVESLHGRSIELAAALRELTDQSSSSLVYWYELTQQAVFLHATPIDVAHICSQHLFRRSSAIVLTSATLSVAGSFEFVRNALGLPTESKHMALSSPFSYQDQAMMYVPKTGFPAPQDPLFCRSVAEQAIEILKKTRGRALFLFTSYRHMNDVYMKIHDLVPYPILVQGQKPKRALLAEFKNKIDSVLMATSSFWQGVDVPGEALSCLLIDKLPFEVPDDPLIASRMEHLEKAGKSSFFNYQVPRAIIHLKQGVGRLIRSSQDRGLIVIFDVRLFTKAYGRLFLQSLPPCTVVRQPDQFDAFITSMLTEKATTVENRAKIREDVV